MARSTRPYEPVRYAVVGLGYISQAAMLPAFAHAGTTSRIAALVSGDAVKRKRLGRRYGAKAVDYADYDALLASGEIDAVYIGLPNAMHRAYAVRAAEAGVHVLCEKPLAVSAAGCEAMVRAAEGARVRLMVAYRLHFDPANLEAVARATRRTIGEPLLFDACFSMQVRPGNSRLEKALGGGTLWDIGIYCINASRYLFRAEPVEVFAQLARSDDPRFRQVERSAAVTMRFPGDRLATFTTSFGAADVSAYRLVGTKGSLRLDPAYEHAGALRLEAKVGASAQERTFPRGDQFAPLLIHFSDCIRTGRTPQPSGREGWADVRIIEALYESAASGRPVPLGAFDVSKRPEPRQRMHRPPLAKCDLVRAQSPTR